MTRSERKPDQPEKAFAELIDRLNIDTHQDRDHRENLKQKMIAAFDASREQTDAAAKLPKPNFTKRTKTMKHLTKIAAAIIVIVGIAAFIGVFTGGIGGSGIAFADVVQPILTAAPASFLPRNQ